MSEQCRVIIKRGELKNPEHREVGKNIAMNTVTNHEEDLTKHMGETEQFDIEIV